jgi:hypothetical protein
LRAIALRVAAVAADSGAGLQTTNIQRVNHYARPGGLIVELVETLQDPFVGPLTIRSEAESL